jgi:hypothetical protein
MHFMEGLQKRAEKALHSSGSEECRLNHGSSILVKTWLPCAATDKAQSPRQESAAGMKTT